MISTVVVALMVIGFLAAGVGGFTVGARIYYQKGIDDARRREY